MKDSPLLSRFRKAFYTIGAFILLALMATVSAAFNLLSISWATPVAIFLLLIALLALNLQSETAARIFQWFRLDLLIPSLKEVVDHHKKLQDCRQVMRKIEHTLEFYNLWGLIYLTSCEQKSGPAGDNSQEPHSRKVRHWFANLHAKLCWEKLDSELHRDPSPPQKHSLPPNLAASIMEADDEDRRIRLCAQGVLKHALKRVKDEYTREMADEFAATMQVNEDLLVLLYRERFLLGTGLLWLEKNELLRPILAEILPGSGRLPPAEPDLPYGPGDLTRLMESLDEFQLDKVRDALLTDLERRRKNRLVAQRMDKTLNHFNLFRLLDEDCKALVNGNGQQEYSFSPDFRRQLIDEPPAFRDDLELICDCSRRVADHMDGSPLGVSQRHLELLYLERHGQNSLVQERWQPDKESSNWHYRLAKILLESKQLPPPQPDFPYSAGALQEIITSLSDFSLNLVRKAQAEDLDRRRENRRIVEKMTITLARYNLFPRLEECGLASKDPLGGIYSLEKQFRRDLIDKPDTETEDERIETCAQSIADAITSCRSSLTTSLLILLYQELHGFAEQVRLTWRTNRDTTGYLESLAQTLLNIPGFPKKEAQTPYTPAELAALIKDIDVYSLDEVKTCIAHDQKIREQTRDEIKKISLTLNLYQLFRLLKPDHVQAGTMEGYYALEKTYCNELVRTLMKTGLTVGEDPWMEAFTTEISQHIQIGNLAAVLDETALDPAAQYLLVNAWQRIRGDLLNLLYRDHYNLATGLLWHNCKGDDAFLTGLVMILLQSKRLPQPDPGLPYGPGDLLKLLDPMENFSLDEARAAVLADQERRRENRIVVERIMAAIDDYGLFSLLVPEARRIDKASGRPTLSPEFRRELIDKPAGLASEQERLEYCAAHIAARMELSQLAGFVNDSLQAGQLPQEDKTAIPLPGALQPALIADILTLLYREYHRLELSKFWLSKSASPDFNLVLAVLLLLGGKLPLTGRTPPYGVLDLVSILKALPEYSFSLLLQELDQLKRVWELVSDFSSFLHTHGVTGPAATFRQVLSQVPLPLQSAGQEEMLARVLTWVGQEKISRAFSERDFPDLSPINGRFGPPVINSPPDEKTLQELARSLSQIAVILFITAELTGRLVLRQQVCEQAGKATRAPYIVFSYLEFKGYVDRELRIDNKEFVSVDYLAKNWARKFIEKSNLPGLVLQNEIQTIRGKLEDGVWPRQLSQMIESAIKDVSTKNQQVNQKVTSLVRRKPNMRKVLEAAFRNLSPDTIARYLEARTRTAYLLTFRVRGGSLAELLKILASEDTKVQATLRSLGINLFADGAHKYNYQQYTDSARIGIIPEGWTFDRFEQAFQEDFEKVIAGRTTLLTAKQLEQNLDALEDIEIIISRFGLSGQNYYGFKIENLTQAKAILQIQALFSEILKPTDIATVIEYQEESLIEVLINLPIVELVACQARTNEGERRGMSDKDRCLKDNLTRKLKCRSIRELASELALHPERTSQAEAVLGHLLYQIPEIEDWNHVNHFASIYIDTLVAFAKIA